MSASKPASNGDTASIAVLATGGSIDKRYSLAGELEIGVPAIKAILDEAGVHLDRLWSAPSP